MVRMVLLKRLLVCLAVFVAVDVDVAERQRVDLERWIIERGEAAGCQVMQAGAIVWGPDGPFFGGGLKVRAFNFAAKHGPWLGGAAAGWLTAVGAYMVCRRLERFRPLGYRGPTRCGRCGYRLAGLREPRCPECGLVI